MKYYLAFLDCLILSITIVAINQLIPVKWLVALFAFRMHLKTTMIKYLIKKNVIKLLDTAL